MSNYYKNSDKDISKQIYVIGNSIIGNSFKPIFDASLNENYIGLNSVYVNEKINATNYLYNGVDICNNCFAVYIDSEQNKNISNIVIPSWCSKIRAILIGGGGGGKSFINTQTNVPANHNIVITNFQFHYDETNHQLMYSYNNSSSSFSSNSVGGRGYTKFQTLTSNITDYTHTGVQTYLNTPNNDRSTNYINVYYQASLLINKLNAKQYNGLTSSFNSAGAFNTDKGEKKTCWQCHYNYQINYTVDSQQNASNPSGSGGGGGSGGDLYYLNDYNINDASNISVSLGYGGNADNDGGDTIITIKNATFKANKGYSTTGSTGNVKIYSFDNSVNIFIKGKSGLNGNTTNGGSGGVTAIVNGNNFINDVSFNNKKYGYGGKGGDVKPAGTNDIGSKGNDGYFRIYFLSI